MSFVQPPIIDAAEAAIADRILHDWPALGYADDQGERAKVCDQLARMLVSRGVAKQFGAAAHGYAMAVASDALDRRKAGPMPPAPSVRDSIEAERERRTAVGRAVDDTLRDFEPLNYANAVRENPARIGAVMVAALRTYGYDVVQSDR